MLDGQDEKPDFGLFRDLAFETHHFEWLFDESFDGIEDDPEADRRFGTASLRFENWFRPFDPGLAVHPYAADEPSA